MSESSNLCLSCGLCCDGTLIGFVELNHEELPALRKLMEIEDESNHGFFLQPCNKYCNGCTIYADRPTRCESFKCKLLTSVEQMTLDSTAARERIFAVRQLKISIEQKLAILKVELNSPSFYFKMIELKKLFKKKETASSLTRDQQALILDIDQLDQLLLKEFGITLD